MSLFRKLSGGNESARGTTKNFFIGCPEAEGESTANSKIKLGEMFGDFLKVFHELDSEKFIITGRKGSGKTAIAEYILFTAQNNANSFCSFIKSRDLNIQKVIQIGKENGLPFEDKLLFEWLILTKLINLFTEDNSLEDYKEFKDLKQFLNKNSGMVDIKEYEILEIVRTNSYDIALEYFKRVFSAKFKRDLGIKEHKAPFYKILPQLQQVVLSLLKENISADNEYILIFDDLDIGFHESDKNSIENITSVLRVAKDYNIDFFGKNGINVKIIILLRDDLKRTIAKYNADTAKIFSSYEIPLVWYEHENYKRNVNAVGLKQLINKRIAANFDKENLFCDPSDPWQSLIRDNPQYNGDSFKFVIDHTFFRPRDLILFFRTLPANEFEIPLSYFDIRKLLTSYVEDLILEIKNELTAIFSQDDIEKIFTSLKNLKRLRTPFSKSQILNEFHSVNLAYNHELAIIHLFDYSIIGNFDFVDGLPRVYFKFREKREEPSIINFELKFIFCKAIELYLEKRESQRQ